MPLGIMMTASHNKYTDNGLKVVCKDGEYFERDVEIIYEEFINTPNIIQYLKDLLTSQSKSAQSKYFFRDNVSRICLGHDTRRSCPVLKKHVIAALDILNSSYNDYGVVTTPQLHWLTYVNQQTFSMRKFVSYVKEDFYWNWLNAAYDAFYEMCERYRIPMDKADKYERKILIDCSCGASSPKVEYIKQIFQKRNLISLNVTICFI